MASLAIGHVVIIGAGLAGLGLAQGLKRNGIDFSIYERDPAVDYRAQGYRIKIFPDTIEHLKQLLSSELWEEFESSCAETVMGESTVNALTANLISSRALAGVKPYTVDRGVMRNVLIQGLEGKINFGKDLREYTINTDGVTVFFRDGSEAFGSLLVGADGGRSAVRQLFMPQFKVVDPKGVCIFGKTPITEVLKTRIMPKMLEWFCVVRDTAPIIQEVIFGGDLPVTMFVEKMSFPSRDKAQTVLPDDYLYWAILLPTQLLGPNEEVIARTMQQPSTQIAMNLASEWHPSLKCILELQDSTQGAAIRIISSPPELPQWEISDKVVLIGDAVHVMSPGGGVGVATALRDCATLSSKLAADGLSIKTIGAYESAMRQYAEASIRRSFRGGNKFFGQPPFENCEEVKFRKSPGES